eukprot:5243722-Pyramimonas_sp.AAC.1
MHPRVQEDRLPRRRCPWVSPRFAVGTQGPAPRGPREALVSVSARAGAGKREAGPCGAAAPSSTRATPCRTRALHDCCLGRPP